MPSDCLHMCTYKISTFCCAFLFYSREIARANRRRLISLHFRALLLLRRPHWWTSSTRSIVHHGGFFSTVVTITFFKNSGHKSEKRIPFQKKILKTGYKVASGSPSFISLRAARTLTRKWDDDTHRWLQTIHLLMQCPYFRDTHHSLNAFRGNSSFRACISRKVTKCLVQSDRFLLLEAALDHSICCSSMTSFGSKIRLLARAQRLLWENRAVTS